MIALSLEEPMSEEAFLRRELGIEWRTVDADAVATSLRSQPTTLLLCSDPNLYLSILRESPAKRALLFLISDEEYTDERRRLAQLPAVRQIYRQYAVRPVHLRSLVPAVGAFAWDTRHTSQSPRVAGTLVHQGTATRRRMAKWTRLGKPVTEVPLGYTVSFEQQWVERTDRVLNNSQSLFAEAMEHGDRSHSVVFLGHPGQPQRIAGLDLAAALPASAIRLVEGTWSGFAHRTGEMDYLMLLLNARFALCPPGFVNGETFRYYEALICGALPIEIRTALTHLGSPAFRPTTHRSPYSWRASLHRAMTLDEPSRLALVEQSRIVVREEIGRIRMELQRGLEIP